MQNEYKIIHMKSILFALVMAIISASAAAKSNWDLVRIDDSIGRPAGYVYHNDAIGTMITRSVVKKVASSFRLICSSTGDDTLLVISWQEEFLTLGEIMVTTYYNNLLVDKRLWQVDKNIIYTDLQSFPLMKKSTRFIKLTWQVGATEYVAGYNAVGFDSEKFKMSCMDK